jgi:hypothetical protein
MAACRLDGERATRAVCGDALRAAYIQGRAPVGRGCQYEQAHGGKHVDWWKRPAQGKRYIKLRDVGGSGMNHDKQHCPSECL